MKGFGAKMQSAGKKLTSIGKDMTKKVTLPIAGIGAVAIKAGMDFEAGMSEVRAISGATGKDLKILEDRARELAKETIFTASEAADALKYMALAGWDTKQMYEGLPAVLNLAAAANMDLARASDIVTDTMSAFQMEAEQSTMAADIFAKTQAMTNTNVELLGEAMKYAGAAANAAGMDLVQTNTILGVFANNSLKGSMAGTTFTALLRDMRKNAEDGALSIGNMSIAIYDAEGNMRDMGSIMADVEEATKNMTTAQKDAALANIFGEQAMRGVNILLAEGSEKYAALEDAIRNSEGASKEMADTMMDNLKGSMEEIKSTLGEAALQIYESLLPSLEKLADKIKAAAEWFTNLDAGTQETIIKLAALGATIGPVILVSGKLATSIGAIAKAYNVLTAATIPAIAAKVADKAETLALIGLYAKDAIAKGASTAATTAMTAATTAWNVVAGIATTATTGLGAAITFLTGPVGLAIAAFAALVAGGIALYKNWDTVMQKCSELKENVVSKTNEMKEGALKRYNELKTGAIKAIDEKKTAIIEKWTELKNDAYEWAGRMMEQFKEGITDKIEAVKTAASNVGSAIAKVLRFRSPTEEGPLSDSDRWMPNFMQMLADGINQNSDKVKESSDSVAQKIGNSLGKVNNYVTHTVGIIEKEFKLWALSNDMVKDSAEYLSKQLEVQKQKHEILNEQIKATELALSKVIAKYGEGSAYAIEYKDKLLSLKLAQTELGKEIDETTGKIEKQTKALERQFEVIERGRSSLVRSGSRFVSRSSGGSSGGKKDGDWYVWTGSDGKIKSGDKSDFDKDTGYDVDDSEVRRIARDNNVDMGVARDMAAENKRKGKKVWHDGGWVGKPLFDIENILALIQKRLRYNEVAGILQEGEFVLSRDTLERIQGAMTSVDMVTTPRTTSSTPTAAASTPAKGGDIHQHITINSPTPLTPSEIARKNLQVSRQLAMEWGL